jgi:hypothetical protein
MRATLLAALLLTFAASLPGCGGDKDQSGKGNGEDAKTQVTAKGPTTNKVQPPDDNRTQPVHPQPKPNVSVPPYDAEGSAARAIELYDADGDGVLAGAELQASPALRAALAQIDADGDGRLNADEIAARMRQWQQVETSVVPIQCQVTLDDKPLAAATVHFVPAPFLSSDLLTAEGITDADGFVALSVGKTEVVGIPCGLYRVEISKADTGREVIPARYNTQTTLGQEVYLDAPGIWSGIRFELQSGQP